MVKQDGSAKNSSISKPEFERYGFQCYIEPASIVPEATELKIVDNLGPGYVDRVPGFFISGSLKNAGQSEWPEPPHVAFANLLADKPEAAETFTKRYGVLSRLYMNREDPDGENFTIDSSTFSLSQDHLQRAWRGDILEIIDIESELEVSFDTDVVVAYGSVELRPKDLWASICFLFLWDLRADKLGYCENPGCPAPYFRKKRKTQKFCEAGPCVAYAQRQYALDWWNRVGKKRREKKAKARRKP
jgi:hypothetical protein